MITSVGSRLRPRSARQAMTMTVLLGAAGAGLAFLATRQGWAQVRTSPPRPLPSSLMTVTGSAMVPYADALVVAGLASLAAVLATRQAWRRISGLILAALGAGLAASAFTVSKAAAVAMMDSLAADGKGTGVRVNSILPSIIDTDVNRQAMPKADFAAWPKPEEIAQVILFLCSDKAATVHGAAVPVYGNS